MTAPPPGDGEGGLVHPGLAEPRTKEDWFGYVFYEPPPRPLLPPYKVYLAQDKAEQRRLNRLRSSYHSALVLAWTPAVRHFETEIMELLEANEYAPPGARPGLLIDGPPTVGKSTLVKMIARKFEQQLREDFPERFVPERLGSYVPVVYISLADQVTPKQISVAFARYLNTPTGGTKEDIDHRILDALAACGTQLVIFDDLHFLDCSHKDGRASNDHIKYLANHAPCTIIGTGVDLEDSPLLSEGGATGRNTQTSGRFSRQLLSPFTLDAERDIMEWAAVIRSLEGSLALYRHEPESLTRRHWRYLHDRTGGSIAALHALIRRSAVRTVREGIEAVTLEVMDSIVLSYAHERGYAKVLELKKRKARVGGTPGPPPVDPARRNTINHLATAPNSAPVDGMIAAVVELPRRLALVPEPHPGESLLSWVDALARTNRISRMQAVRLASFLHTTSTGHRAPARFGSCLSAETVKRVQAATGLSPAQLHAMTLLHYAGGALPAAPPTPLGPRRVSAWLRRHGLALPARSRACPACLRDSGGRWLLKWRLTWSFACVKHRVYLIDHCRGCGKPLHQIWPGPGGSLACHQTDPGLPRQGPCPRLIHRMRAPRLTDEHLLACQQRLDALISDPPRPGGQETLHALHQSLDDIATHYDDAPPLPDTDTVLHQRWQGHRGVLRQTDDSLLSAALIKIATMGGITSGPAHDQAGTAPWSAAGFPAPATRAPTGAAANLFGGLCHESPCPTWVPPGRGGTTHSAAGRHVLCTTHLQRTLSRARSNRDPVGT